MLSYAALCVGFRYVVDNESAIDNEAVPQQLKQILKYPITEANFQIDLRTQRILSCRSNDFM